MKLARRTLGKTALALAIALWAGGASAEVELYRPQHRAADELARLVDPLLGEGGSAAADPGTGTVLVSGDADARATARRLLSELDVPLAQYRVESRIESREALRLRGFALEGELGLGPLALARVRPPDPAAQAAVRFRRLETEEMGRREASLLVREGDTAELWTGSLVPIRVRNFELRDGEERVLESEPLLGVRTGLQVRPRALPQGGVELELWAVSAGAGREGAITRTSTSTRVRLAPGEWLALTRLSSAETWSDTAPLHAEEIVRDEILLIRLQPQD